MSKSQPKPQGNTLPLAGRVAKPGPKVRGAAGEEGDKPRSLAKKLRTNPTASEVRLWNLLYGLRIDGYHFRKQVKLGPYYVDFVCLHAGLIIEVDGITHESDRVQRNDVVRDDYLRGRGFTVLRFATQDVMRNPVAVGDTIVAALVGKTRSPRGSSPPSPTLPARGRVPASGISKIEPQAPRGTSPLAGEAGRGGAPHSNPAKGKS